MINHVTLLSPLRPSAPFDCGEGVFIPFPFRLLLSDVSFVSVIDP